MKTSNIKQTATIFLGLLLFFFTATSCSKNSDKPGSSTGIPGTNDYGTHNIDPKLKGEWMWTSGSDGGYYDDNGTWVGSAYGFAMRTSIDAKGNGTLYSHIFSDLGGGSYLAVDIYYTGYYEMDNAGNLTFYSMGGRYVSSSGTDRPLSGDEIYNPSTGSGRTLSFPAIQFKTIGGRACFTTTSSGEEEAFYKQ